MTEIVELPAANWSAILGCLILAVAILVFLCFQPGDLDDEDDASDRR